MLIRPHTLIEHKVICANNTTAVQEAITRIQDCITDVSNWMSRSALKINEDKTEFIIFSAKHYTFNQMSIQIGTNTIQHNNNVKILGVTLDAHLKSRSATPV